MKNRMKLPKAELEHLFYIEVDSDNPVYESREGLLYSRTDGSLILRPAGR